MHVQSVCRCTRFARTYATPFAHMRSVHPSSSRLWRDTPSPRSRCSRLSSHPPFGRCWLSSSPSCAHSSSASQGMATTRTVHRRSLQSAPQLVAPHSSRAAVVCVASAEASRRPDPPVDPPRRPPRVSHQPAACSTESSPRTRPRAAGRATAIYRHHHRCGYRDRDRDRSRDRSLGARSDCQRRRPRADIGRITPQLHRGGEPSARPKGGVSEAVDATNTRRTRAANSCFPHQLTLGFRPSYRRLRRKA